MPILQIKLEVFTFMQAKHDFYGKPWEFKEKNYYSKVYFI